jgi:hypothetical protein
MGERLPLLVGENESLLEAFPEKKCAQTQI